MILMGGRGISGFQLVIVGGPTLLTSVTIADVPDYVLAHFKPDKFWGNDFKGLSLTTWPDFGVS
jgi:hypothetical protein